MSSNLHPDDVRMALRALEAGLLRNARGVHRQDLEKALAQVAARMSETPDDSEAQVEGAWRQLNDFPEALESIQVVAGGLSQLRSTVLPGMLESAVRLGIEEGLVDHYVSVILDTIDTVEFETPAWRSRSVISIGEGGVGGAETRKLKNITIARHKLLELGAHTGVMTAHGIAHPHPVLLAVGIALLAHSLREAASIRIPEQEASVLWGLIQAQMGPPTVSTVSEVEIVRVTNAERQKSRNGIRLGAPLPDESVRRSLESLERLYAVARDEVTGEPTRWRLMETYRAEPTRS